MAGPSMEQMVKLVEYMEENPMLARGQLRGTIGRFRTKAKWEEMAMMLNSIDGIQKDTKQWTRFWADKKYNLKRMLIAQRNAAEYRLQRGLIYMPKPLSDLDARILFLTSGVRESDWLQVKNQSNASTPSTSHAAPAMATPTVVSSAVRRRRPHIMSGRQRSQGTTGRQRHIRTLPHRVTAEVAQAISLRKAVRALDKLTRAVVMCGENIVEALNNLL